jgi:hypothetical protein
MLVGPPVCTITPGLAFPAKTKAAPTHHVVLSERLGDLVFVVDHVLQREHRRALAQ